MKRFRYLLLLVINTLIISFLSLYELQAQKPMPNSQLNEIEKLLKEAKRTHISNPDSSIIYARTLMAKGEQISSTKYIALAYLELAIAHNALKKIEEAHQYYDKSIEFFGKIKDKKNMAEAQHAKAIAYSSATNFAEASQYFELSLNYADEANDTSFIARISLNYGVVYARKGEYYPALKFFFKSLESFESLGNTQYAPAISNNIGSIYREMNQPEKALVYFQKTEKIISDNENKDSDKVALYLNMGLVYSDLNNYDKAIENYNTVIELSEKLNTNRYNGLIYNNIGEAYELQGQYEKALSFYEKAIPFRRENNNKYGLAKTLQGLSNVNYELGNFGLSLKFITESLSINEEIRDREGKAGNLKWLASIYRKKGDNSKAFTYLEQYLLLQDSLDSENKVDEMLKVESEYEYKQKEMLINSEVQILRKDKRIQQSRQTILLLWLFLLTIALVAVFWIFYQNKKKTILLEKDLENKTIIERQSKALEEASEARSRFFTSIAHELRTPLTLIAGPINNVLTKHQVNKNIKQELYIAQKNTRQLKQLVNQILDLSKNDIEGLKAEVSSFKFIDLYQFLVNEFSSYANYQNINFQATNTISEALVLTTDAEKFLIILKNILSNAFKFTSNHGSIDFQCFDNQDQIEVIIKDNGQGIHSEDLPHIFDRYFQTKQIQRLIEGGTGIGLATSKEYITLLKGEILVESEFGKGSVFKVILPKKIRLDNAIEVKDNYLPSFLSERALSTSKMVLLETIFNPNVINNILVVEDNLDICQYLQTILKEEYNITFAHNGKEALTFLEKYQPNLIITDLMMPIMNGYELLERLKKDKRYRKIPIIALTARAEFSDKLKALKIGIDDYLLKPFEEKELKARIKNLLKNLESRMDFREEIVLSNETKPSPSSPTINIFNENNLSKEDLQWLEKLQEETLKGISNFDFNVNYLSEAMFLSPSQLYRRIKAFTGFTP